jgi:hypothetical protein
MQAQKAEEERAARAALLKRLLAEDDERERNRANGIVPESNAPKNDVANTPAAVVVQEKEEEAEVEIAPVKIKVIPPRYQKQQRRGGKAYSEMSEAERQKKERYGQQLLAAMQEKQKADTKYQAMQEVRTQSLSCVCVCVCAYEMQHCVDDATMAGC